MKRFAIGAAVLLGLLLAPWIFLGNDYFLARFFAPRREAVRRQVFEESRSFRQGTIQELENIQREYATAGPDHQAALRSIALRRVSDFPVDELPPHLRAFVAQLRSEP